MPPSLGDLYEENEWKLQNIGIFSSPRDIVARSYPKQKHDPDIISLHPFSEFIILVPNENDAHETDRLP